MKWPLTIAICSLAAPALAQYDPTVSAIVSRGWPDTRYTVHYHVVQKNLVPDNLSDRKVDQLLARVTFAGGDEREMSMAKEQLHWANQFKDRSYDCYYVKDLIGFYYEATLQSVDGKAPEKPMWSAYCKLPNGKAFVYTSIPGLNTSGTTATMRLNVKTPMQGVDFPPLFGVHLAGMDSLPDPSVAEDLRNEKDIDGYLKAQAPYPRQGPGGFFEWDAGYAKLGEFDGVKVLDTYVAGDFNRPFAVTKFSNFKQIGGLPVACTVVTDFYMIPALTGVQESVKEEEVAMTLESLETTPDAGVAALLSGLIKPDTIVMATHPDGSLVTMPESDCADFVSQFFAP